MRHAGRFQCPAVFTPQLRAEYQNRAAALGYARAAMDFNAHAGDLAAELAALRERHARLEHRLDGERARGDALAATLRWVLERLEPLTDIEGASMLMRDGRAP